MSEVIYKIRVDRPCRLFIDEEEVMTLEKSKLTKIILPEGEYLRKVVAIDNTDALFDEKVVSLFQSKVDLIELNLKLQKALPNVFFSNGQLNYEPSFDRLSVVVTCDEENSSNYSFKTIIIPAQIVCKRYNYPVTSIGNKAFKNCRNLTSITIPNSVTRIGNKAFKDCQNLTSITIPNSVTSIGEKILDGCEKLTSIIVEVGNEKYDSRKNCNAIIETETNTLIIGCRTTIIPDDVTSIGESAFHHCEKLTSIKIPNGVTTIEGLAFCGCRMLTDVTIPNSVESIGDQAFDFCDSLREINYEGTKAQWKKIEKGYRIINHDNYGKDEFYKTAGSVIQLIHCKDGDIKL